MTHVTPQWMIEQGFSPTFADRFWSKVGKTNSCWIWKAYTTKTGYGQIGNGNKIIRSHRASWMIHFGPIPAGKEVCHNCPGGDNPACVNPDHLWLGTRAENATDAGKKGRLSVRHHYKHKHPKQKLTVSQVIEIRKQWPGTTMKSLAERFGVCQESISFIVHRRNWSHI